MPKTNNELYLMARNALKKAGVEAYTLEARIIAAHACGKTKEAFLRDLALYSSNECEQRVKELIARRLNGEPMAYVTGEWEFFGEMTGGFFTPEPPGKPCPHTGGS